MKRVVVMYDAEDVASVFAETAETLREYACEEDQRGHVYDAVWAFRVAARLVDEAGRGLERRAKDVWHDEDYTDWEGVR